jgi:uncharacterized membrane protein
MATLVGLVYPDLETARAAQTTALGLEQAGFLRVLDYTIVEQDGDKLKTVDKPHPVRKGALLGAVFGGIVGTFMFMPVVGAAAGAALGGGIGKSTQSSGEGDVEALAKQIGDELQPGGAAFIMLGATDGPERIISEMSRHGGKLVSGDISDDQVARVQEQLDKGHV